MVGTQAFIGIKQKNGSFLGDKYNVTEYIKIGCNLLPSAIDLNVSKLEFSSLEHIQYHIIEATIHLPQTANISNINHVWQVGKNASGMEPKIHEKTLKNYDSAETIDLHTGEPISIRSARRRHARILGISERIQYTGMNMINGNMLIRHVKHVDILLVQLVGHSECGLEILPNITLSPNMELTASQSSHLPPYNCHLEHAPFLFTFIALGSHSWSFIVPTFVFTARDSRSQRVVSLLHRTCGQRSLFAKVRVGQPHDRDQGLMFTKSSDLDRLSTFFVPKSYFSISEFLELGLR
ncbi:hypothetical protein CQW23_16962 [Capsicum baccatum]|uniref:AIR12 DOMON domain-containing protein n=1 Tax=Capsicum baccatum TaxID=33114 RepID=A0A2G2WCI5_CAPBA|nr:hypothetical protein CQW23_16962 [Capsicum baccatum]